MDPLEDRLREAMGRVEPPDGFAGRVLARVAEERAKPSLLERLLSVFAMPKFRLVAAAVMCLMVVAGVGYQREMQHRAEGARAKDQVMLALEITARKIQVAQRGIERLRTADR